MREAVLVGKIIRAVRAKYPLAYVRKLADRFSRGLPDLLIAMAEGVVCAGTAVQVCRILFVEVKVKEGRLSKVQEAEHMAIRAAGAEVLVVRSIQEVLDVLSGRSVQETGQSETAGGGQ